jgi:hypothetical protein
LLRSQVGVGDCTRDAIEVVVVQGAAIDLLLNIQNSDTTLFKKMYVVVLFFRYLAVS